MPAAQTLALADFLLARIAEDEAAANDPRYVWSTDIGERVQNPARVLAECEAKRRIVEDFLCVDSYNWGMDDIATGEMNVLERSLALFAAVYADHADFNEEWRA